jgi:hypothetical protein
MRILIALRQPSLGGGVRGHTETVARELQHTGHDVLIFSHDDLPWRDAMERTGLRTTGSLAALEGHFDVAIAHDQPSAFDLLAARGDIPLTFVWHGNIYDVDMAPQLDDAVRIIFQPYGPLPTRADATAAKARIVPVRQPIDVERFCPLGPIGERPRRAVAISNYMTDIRRTVLTEACAQLGIEIEFFGFHEQRGPTRDPQLTMNGADIVFGKARVAMEAMACGRAVFVFDVFGTDGFVDEHNIEALLSRGMGGSSTPMTTSVDQIVEELGRYDQRMGMVNRDLARHHFPVSQHAATLVNAIEEMLGAEQNVPCNDGAFELARLSRTSWYFESELHVLRHKFSQVEYRAMDLEHENEVLRRRVIDTELYELTVHSRRWRLMNAVMRPLDRLRRRA